MKLRLRFALAGAVILLAGCQPEPPPPAAPSVIIRIRTEPKGAAVTLDGKKQPVESPCEIQADGGGHLLELSLPGYQPVWRRVPPSDRPDQVCAVDDIELQPKTVPAVFTSVPPGAFVKVDGQDVGTAPVFVPALRLGAHKVDFEFKAGYAPISDTVDVKEGEPLLLKRAAESIIGMVRVITAETNAKIFIDGTFRGRTGREGEALEVKELPEGEHLLTVRKDGCKEFEEKFLLARNENKLLKTPKLELLPGTVVIVSVPPGAGVYRDEQQIGSTPLTLAGEKPGTLTLTVAKGEYDPQVKVITVVPGVTKTVEVILERNVGGVALVTEPPGCTVYVDGQRVGTTAASGTPNVSVRFERPGLKPGPHTVKVEHAGYAPQERKILVEKDLFVELKTIKLKEIWLPTHRLKTRTGTKILEVRVLGRTAMGSREFEYIKDGARITFDVAASDIETLEEIK